MTLSRHRTRPAAASVARAAAASALAAIALLWLWAALTSARAAEVVPLDGERLRISFSVETLVAGRIEGRIPDTRGEMRLDRAALTNSRLEVRVGTRSIVTEGGRFEDQLRSPRFFDAERHPEMRFETTSLELPAGGPGRIAGLLTLLGVTRPLTLGLELRYGPGLPGEAMWLAGFVASGLIRRSDWGMTSLIPVVADEVALRIEVALGK